jgi:hypothetical protein
VPLMTRNSMRAKSLRMTSVCCELRITVPPCFDGDITMMHVRPRILGRTFGAFDNGRVASRVRGSAASSFRARSIGILGRYEARRRPDGISDDAGERGDGETGNCG